MTEKADIIVRKAVLDDKESCLDMAEKFYSLAGYSAHIPFNREDCGLLFDSALEQGLVFVADHDGPVGIVLGLTMPSIVNRSYLVGSELIWWVNPEYRGIGRNLLRSIQDAAQEIGIKMWSMISLESTNPEIAEGLYLSEGYTKTESTFVRFF